MELKDTLLMGKTTFEMKANLPVKEPKMVEFWQSISLYEKMLAAHKDSPTFVLHDGPPYANGDIHVGHMLNRILKDVTIRYKFMRGYRVPFVFGWDTHGLPIENYLAKKGINRKTMSIPEFRAQCEAFARSQVERQKTQLIRLGVIGDLKQPYLTLTPAYEAEQIKVFAKMAMKGLIYKGLKPVYWSWSSESALAEAEIVYEDVVDQSLYATFAVEDGKGVIPQDASIVIWTTTPWTLPANLAIAAHAHFDYGVYQTENGRFVVAIGLIEEIKKVSGWQHVKLEQTVKGKALEGVTTHHPFLPRLSPIILGDHVTLDAGSGFVHTAPGHGEEDFIVGLKYGLPPLCPVDSRGIMTQEAGEALAGKFYQDANQWVIDTLKQLGKALAVLDYPHPYPHDWRTGKPLIYRATPQWFASIEPIRETLLSEIKRVKWTPSWGQQRIHNMIKDRGDWCISRQRAWGVPIPIIYHEDDSPIIDEAVFDHIATLIQQHGSSIWFEKDVKDLLPPGYHDARSPHGQFRKETDIMDVWFDSGSSASAVLKTRGLPYPADVYLEGSDQYRGWFNSSLIIAVATEGKAPYEQVVSHGFVVDGKGEKMSKSKGNGIDPLKMMQVYGADIMRLWASSIDFTADARASEMIFKGQADMYRKVRNTFKFLLANLTSDASMMTPPSLAWVDTLILNALFKVQHTYQRAMDAFDYGLAVQTLTTFMTQDLSSFYLDISKDILYCESIHSLRRKQVQYVLHVLLTELLKMWTPIMPFTMEEVYQTLPHPSQPSAQLLTFAPLPKVDASLTPILEALYALRQEASKALETLRAEGHIGSSLEAKLSIQVSDPLFSHLFALDTFERQRLFIVSEVELIKGHTQQVKASPFVGEKCPRCWNYFPHLTPVFDTAVCKRCHEVIQHDYHD